MKKSLYLLLGLGLLLSCSPAVTQAITIGFEPLAQAVQVGNSVSIALTISGLVNESEPSLGGFDLNVSFDPAILSFDSVMFGDPDPDLGDQLDLAGFGSVTILATTPGFVNLYELSLDGASDLNTLQEDSFTLATLTLETLALGTSHLSLSDIILSDADGAPFPVNDIHLVDGSVTVAPVPEPGTMVLLGTGLVGLLGYGWRRRIDAHI